MIPSFLIPTFLKAYACKGKKTCNNAYKYFHLSHPIWLLPKIINKQINKRESIKFRRYLYKTKN